MSAPPLAFVHSVAAARGPASEIRIIIDLSVESIRQPETFPRKARHGVVPVSRGIPATNTELALEVIDNHRQFLGVTPFAYPHQNDAAMIP